MNKKGEDNSIWTIAIAILVVIVLILLIWIFRDNLLALANYIKEVIRGVTATDINVTEIATPP